MCFRLKLHPQHGINHGLRQGMHNGVLVLLGLRHA